MQFNQENHFIGRRTVPKTLLPAGNAEVEPCLQHVNSITHNVGRIYSCIVRHRVITQPVSISRVYLFTSSLPPAT